MKVTVQTKRADETDITVGANIRRIRELRRMPQEKLAAAIGVTFQQVQKYEKGANRVSASKLALIAQALACTITDLFGDTIAETVDSLSLPRLSRHALRVAVAFDAIPDDRQRLYVMRLVESMGNPPPAANAIDLTSTVVDLDLVAIGGRA